MVQGPRHKSFQNNMVALVIALGGWLAINWTDTVLAQSQPPQFAWAREAGGTNFDKSYGIAIGPNGDCLLTGTFNRTVEFWGTNLTTSTGQADAFVARLDPEGNPVWIRQVGGDGEQVAYAAAFDPQDNCYVTGSFSYSANFDTLILTNTEYLGLGSDAFLAKYSPAGDLMWANQVSGPGDCQGRRIALDAAGNCWLGGNFSGTADFGNGLILSNPFGPYQFDLFLAKYDANGQVQWARQAGGTKNEICNGIGMTLDGNCLMSGTFQSTNLNIDAITLTSSALSAAFLAKFDNHGNLLWARQASGPNAVEGNGVAVDGAGNSYVAGDFSGVVSFGTLQATNSGQAIFLAKYDNDGNTVWIQQAGGGFGDTGYAVAVDRQGNPYVAGQFSGSADFGGTNTINTAEGDLCIAKYSSRGALVWVRQAGGSDYTGLEGPLAIGLDDLDNAYIAGFFLSSTAVFGATTLTNRGSGDIFVSKLYSEIPSLRICPAENYVTISWPARYAGFTPETATSAAATNWIPITNAPVIVDDQNFLTNGVSDTSRFFRLRGP